MEIRHAQKKVDDRICKTILCIFINTHQRFRSKAYDIKQEEPEGKPKKANQNKENRNTKTRKQ